MEFEKINKDKYLKIYWEGHQNRLIRLWVYLLRGLNMFNEFKYVLAAIVAGFVILKITEPIWMVVAGLAVIPPLIVLGRWQLRKAGKVDQWIATEHGSVLKWADYNIKVETLNKLDEISKKLDKLGGK